MKRQLQPQRARSDADAGDAPKDHSAVGVTHARACEGKDLDPSQVAQISWCQAVRVLIELKSFNSHL